MRITMFMVSCLTLLGTLVYPSLSSCETAPTSGKDLASIFNAVFAENADFPKRFTDNPQALIDEPDITVFFSRKHLNALLATQLKTPIYLDHTSKGPRSSITADKWFVRSDPSRNVLLVFITGGVLNLESPYAGMGGILNITHAEFELAPVFKKNSTGQVLLETRLRCVGLDLDQAAPTVDRGIAHLLQSLYLDKQPIDAINITEAIPAFSLIKDAEDLDMRLTEASIHMVEKGIEIRSAWTVR